MVALTSGAIKDQCKRHAHLTSDGNEPRTVLRGGRAVHPCPQRHTNVRGSVNYRLCDILYVYKQVFLKAIRTAKATRILNNTECLWFSCTTICFKNKLAAQSVLKSIHRVLGTRKSRTGSLPRHSGWETPG
jgi:hypothetical protein